MIYLLTMRDGKIERWECEAFHNHVKSSGNTIGINFQARLSQLRNYTEQDVIDWEMIGPESPAPLFNPQYRR